jgi:tRNA (guanosine-2'-O-)-methyltransferase
MRRRQEDLITDSDDDPAVGAYAPSIVIEALENQVTDARRQRIREVLDRRLQSVTVVVDNLHDPHNGAAIVRSCDAFGVQSMHAIVSDEPFSAARAVARGSQKWVHIHQHRASEECIESLKAADFVMVATHPEGSLVPDDLATIPRVAVVLGNERVGISTELSAACAHAVRVPMVGFVESLNVSVTTAILLHAACHRRPGDLPPVHWQALFARALWLTVPRAAERVEAFVIQTGRLRAGG